MIEIKYYFYFGEFNLLYLIFICWASKNCFQQVWAEGKQLIF